MNNNTSTSNSRSSKKSSKKASAAVTVEQLETVTSIPVEDVEITVLRSSTLPTEEAWTKVDNSHKKSSKKASVSVDNSSTLPTEEAPVANTVDTNTSVSEPEQESEQESEPESEAKPVANIWKLREQARVAEEALVKANEVIAKLVKEAAKPTSTPTSAPAPTEEGWTKVDNSRKSASSKPKYEKSDKPKYEKSDKSKYEKSDKSKSYEKSDKSKSFAKPKEPSAEQLASRERKNEALMVAQDQLIAECFAQMPSKTMERICTDLQYIKDYRRTQVLKFEDDFVVAEVNGEKFEFSRTRFFENRIFQNKMREKFETHIPDAWVRLFPGRDENTYCAGISKKREYNA